MIIVPAFLGLIFCLLNLFGADFLCLTSGCAIYAEYSLFGLSFYGYGAIAFALILVLAFYAGKKPILGKVLLPVILLGLFLDTLFLGWQVFFWPCFSCLIVAFLLGWIAIAYWFKYPSARGRLFTGVFLLWFIFLVPVSISAGKEVFLSPWPIYGPEDASIQVFFSPTCPACATEIAKLLQSPYAERVAYYPVAKDERDIEIFAAFLQEDLSSAADLRRLFLEKFDEAVEPERSLRWNLLRNKMRLASHGAETIPYMISSTVLEIPQTEGFDGMFSSPAPWEQPEVGGCGFFGAQDEPCD
jgi:hypothetical protein